MGNIVNLDVITTLDIDPNRVIESLKDAKLTDIIVIGYDEEGEFYFAGSKADGGEALWMLEMAKNSQSRSARAGPARAGAGRRPGA